MPAFSDDEQVEHRIRACIRWTSFREDNDLARVGGQCHAAPLRRRVERCLHVAAVEFVAGRHPPAKFETTGAVAAKVTKACLEHGVITRALPEGDSISFSPPFVITEAEIDEVVRVTREAADRVAEEVL